MDNIITVKANWKLHFNADNKYQNKHWPQKECSLQGNSLPKTKQNKNSKLQAAQSTDLKFSPKNNWP